MALLFPSVEWIKALHAELNKSQEYQEVAKKWEGDLCLIVKAGPGIPNDTYLYLDLWHLTTPHG